MGITECIFSISKDVFTPFYLGLAVQLYHNVGSKQLIETLYSHGLCASYGEVRRYLTSIVHYEMEKLHDDVHVPDIHVCNSIDPVICQILPAVHAVSGCDTTSSMFGIGKRRPSDFIDLSSLADCHIDQSVYAARKLVARLYDQK